MATITIHIHNIDTKSNRIQWWKKKSLVAWVDSGSQRANRMKDEHQNAPPLEACCAYNITKS
jgi:hypothetical protein